MEKHKAFQDFENTVYKWDIQS